MNRAAETITRINDALAVCVDQITGDALRDARDLIADQMAENERLIEALKAQLAANVSVSDHAVEQVRRAYSAESQLRALASAEPVACISPAELAHLKRARSAIVIPADAADADDVILIRRPGVPNVG